MIIYPPEIQFHDDLLRVSSRFTTEKQDAHLWFEVDKKYADYVMTDKIDAFLVGLLPLAMRLGEDIHLKHPVSEKMYFNVSNNMVALINDAFPEFKRISVFADGFADESKVIKGKVVAVGLSCGTDSLCTIADNSSSDIPGSYRITHGVFTNVGSHGSTDDAAGKERFLGRLENAKGCASELGLEFVVIDSNMEQILSSVTDYDRTSTFRNISAVLILEKLFFRYFLSSGLAYRDLKVRKGNSSTFVRGRDSAGFDPITLPCLSTSALEFISYGSQYKRTEKTAIVSDFEASYRWFNVCAAQSKNCSVCRKCVRTLLTLDLLGKVERYEAVLDLDKYRREKRGFICFILATKKTSSINREVAELMTEVDYHPPLSFYPYFAGYWLGFKTIVAGRKVLDAVDKRLQALPRMRASKMLGPLRFALYAFIKIEDHRTDLPLIDSLQSSSYKKEIPK